jgi:putative peptidoglycan lipid II flippase
MLLGSIIQVAMQLPGLRGVPIRLSLNWRHPGIAQIVRLFLPVAGGLVLAQLAALFSYIIAGQIGTEGPATMRYAAQVIQFPLGMIVVAISSAILPSLSRYGTAAALSDFKTTLTQGMRLVWVLIGPAAVGLFVLAEPIVVVLFERGAFTAESTAYTAMALRAAVPGLVFAAIDQPLIFAFYARRDTRTPTIIGLVSTVSYLVLVAVLSLLAQAQIRTFTLMDLIFANSMKTGLDALLMAIFLARKIGGLRHYDMLPLALKVLLASAIMGVVVYGVVSLIQTQVVSRTFLNSLFIAAGGALAGMVVYAVSALFLGIREIRSLRSFIKK